MLNIDKKWPKTKNYGETPSHVSLMLSCLLIFGGGLIKLKRLSKSGKAGKSQNWRSQKRHIGLKKFLKFSWDFCVILFSIEFFHFLLIIFVFSNTIFKLYWLKSLIFFSICSLFLDNLIPMKNYNKNWISQKLAKKFPNQQHIPTFSL